MSGDLAYLGLAEAADLIRGVEPAGVILQRIVREAEAALARRFA